jgi:hypothetical protein
MKIAVKHWNVPNNIKNIVAILLRADPKTLFSPSFMETKATRLLINAINFWLLPKVFNEDFWR